MLDYQNLKVYGDIFGFYNTYLFNDELPVCNFSFSQRGKTRFIGSKSGRNFSYNKNDIEIVIDKKDILLPEIELHALIVSNMVFVWQFKNGLESNYMSNLSGRVYCNKHWADKMLEIGLTPTSTGKEGGKMLGLNIRHMINEGGKFACLFNKASSTLNTELNHT